MRILILTLATATVLAGCAMTPNSGPNRYRVELDELDASCKTRGGILQPTGRQGSARPQEDYVCRITGSTSDRFGRSGD